MSDPNHFGDTGPLPPETDSAGSGPPLPGTGDLILGGKYRLEKQLGSGGMGVVFAARHVTLRQEVAIKFLNPKAASSDELAVERFLREAQAAATIRNEHVARVSDTGTLENGTPYILMEHLTGLDLSQLVERHGALPAVDAIRYVLEACEALTEAHAMGIVHRDLKPSNLFLAERPDGSRTIKILDFGISKMSTGEGPGLTTTLSVPGEIIGSPYYMSPEQIRGSDDIDARTDVWSLGMVLHELVSGRPMFDNPSLSALCAKITTDPPVPLRSACPDASEALERIILRCLEKEPAARYPSVHDLAGALGALTAAPSGPSLAAFADTGPVRAPGGLADPQTASKTSFSSTGEPTSPSMPPGRRQAWAIAGVGAVLAAAGVLYAVQPDKPLAAPMVPAETTPARGGGATALPPAASSLTTRAPPIGGPGVGAAPGASAMPAPSDPASAGAGPVHGGHKRPVAGPLATSSATAMPAPSSSSTTPAASARTAKSDDSVLENRR